MSLFGILNISASGLTAQRVRQDVISQNIANVETTRSADGGPYRRKVVVFEENRTQAFQGILNDTMQRYTNANGGVKVSAIRTDTSPLKREYDPSHPDADNEGYVSKPNVNIIEEMTNMISATRAYEANITVMNGVKSMATKAMQIGK